MAVQVNLTYEAIFDALVTEKSREELQKLDEAFFANVSTYIKSKNDLLSSDDDSRDKILQQIQNTKRMLRELYERREKKILNLALVASRTSVSFVDTANMLSVEKKLFDGILGQLDNFRKNVLQNILNSRAPINPEKQQAPVNSDYPGFVSADALVEPGLKIIKFLKPVPSFVGRELEVYGPFEPGQEAKLPSELAEILIGQGSAADETN